MPVLTLPPSRNASSSAAFAASSSAASHSASRVSDDGGVSIERVAECAEAADGDGALAEPGGRVAVVEVDAHERRLGVARQLVLAEAADRRHRLARADLDDGERRAGAEAVEPPLQPVLLLLDAPRVEAAVAEHEHVRPQKLTVR